MGIISDLINNNIDTGSAVERALADSAVLSELLEGIQSNEDPIRYNSFNVILLISEKNPVILYPHWQLFEKMLGSDNSYFRLIAIKTISNLARIDTEKCFEPLFDNYFKELGGNKTMTAAHVASNAGKIAHAKPALQPIITNTLLRIDEIHRGKQIDLIKGISLSLSASISEKRTQRTKTASSSS
jgi:hypothetical protein